jgi:metallo-beta-lactamase family protein
VEVRRPVLRVGLCGECGSVEAPLDTEFGEQPRHVVLDRFLGEIELLADLPVGPALADQCEDLPLAGRRTEVVLHQLAELRRTGRLPAGAPVYVDSPMALAALQVYRDAFAVRSPELRPDVLNDTTALGPEPFQLIHSLQESLALERSAVPCVLVSASGMATGGRVVHHLRRLLPDPRNTVVVVGYAAEGTRARQLVDGARVLKMYGTYVPVRAEVVNVPAFSAHADAAEIIDWLRAAPPPSATYLVHGQPEGAEALRDRIDRELGWTAVVPRSGERVLVH